MHMDYIRLSAVGKGLERQYLESCVMDTNSISCSCLCKDIQGKQSNRRVVCELLMGQSFIQLWDMRSRTPTLVMTLGTRLWE